MSDDDKDGAWNANSGVTLPNVATATYNISFSPLFMERSSYNDSQTVIIGRGSDGYFWSNGSSTSWTGTSYRLVLGVSYIWPSTGNTRSLIHSLRCLVSTNNRIMDKEDDSWFLVSASALVLTFDSDPSVYFLVLALTLILATRPFYY